MVLEKGRQGPGAVRPSELLGSQGCLSSGGVVGFLLPFRDWTDDKDLENMISDRGCYKYKKMYDCFVGLSIWLLFALVVVTGGFEKQLLEPFLEVSGEDEYFYKA